MVILFVCLQRFGLLPICMQQQNTWHVSSDDIFDVDALIQFCFLRLQKKLLAETDTKD